MKLKKQKDIFSHDKIMKYGAVWLIVYWTVYHSKQLKFSSLDQLQHNINNI